MAATLSNYGVNTNVSGVNGFGRQPAKNLVGIFVAKLAATTDTTLAVPNIPGVGRAINSQTGDKNQVLAIFSYEDEATVFVANGAVATPNATAGFVASSGVINPTAFIVNGGDTLHFYALSEKTVSVEFYSIN